MKKYRVYIGIFAVALTVLVFYFFCIHREWSAKESLSRAQVAKMLAFLKYDQTGCEEILEATKDFLPTDVDSDQWYGKYVAVVLKEELMDAADDKGFHPLDKFCYEDLVRIMEKFHLSEESFSFSIKNKKSLTVHICTVRDEFSCSRFHPACHAVPGCTSMTTYLMITESPDRIGATQR